MATPMLMTDVRDEVLVTIWRFWWPIWWDLCNIADELMLAIVMWRWQWCWRFYDGDRFEMLVTESSCWWLFVNSCFWCIKSVIKIFKLSPILRLQHPSSTWVSLSRNTQIRNFSSKYIFCLRSWSRRRSSEVRQSVEHRFEVTQIGPIMDWDYKNGHIKR